MSEQAEQLVLDYLRRVGDAAHGVLRSDHRLAFVTRLRGRIQEMCANAGATNAADVAKVLNRFGDPTALVAREQRRLEDEERSRADVALAAPMAAPIEEEIDDEPSTEPLPVVEAEPDVTAEIVPGFGQPSDPAPAPEAEAPTTRAEPEPRRVELRPGQSTPQARPAHSGPPLYQPPSARRIGADVPAITARLLARLPPETRDRLRRSSLLEAVGVTVLGVGGLLFPVPMWFLGAIAVLPSADWNRMEKAIGILAAPVLVVLGALANAPREGGWTHWSAYTAVVQAYGWTFFRIGCAVGAGYLAWRMITRIQPRRRRPPWRRANPPRMLAWPTRSGEPSRPRYARPRGRRSRPARN